MSITGWDTCAFQKNMVPTTRRKISIIMDYYHVPMIPSLQKEMGYQDCLAPCADNRNHHQADQTHALASNQRMMTASNISFTSEYDETDKKESISVFSTPPPPLRINSALTRQHRPPSDTPAVNDASIRQG
jgi:hypothetical protein